MVKAKRIGGSWGVVAKGMLKQVVDSLHRKL